MTDYLESKNAYVPEQNGVYGQCKLTELHAYAGENNRCAFSVAMLEEILGMKMDYYVKVDSLPSARLSMPSTAWILM